MTKTKSTKHALLLSALSLLLCVSMLVGSTYAWFTDSVVSGNNVIKSGNLDIELEYWNGTEWKDVKGASDILTNELWEPGVTEVAYLRVANAGSLSLKYQLGINILNEIEGTNQAGEKFRLSNYIMFGVIEDVNGETGAYTKDDAGRAKAIADATDAKKIYEGYSKASTMNPNDELYLALVVYMPTTVDNKANHNGTDVPMIDLGINVYATQYTYENDSFNNQYDANAAFSVWNGVVPTEMPETLVVDGTTQTVHVKDAAAFAYLSTLSADWAALYSDGQGTTYTNYANGKGGNYYYSGQWTISLESNIDLNNYAIAPVDIVFGQSTGATAFNGNGHTIRNINTTTGLFANGTRASFSGLTLENVKATNGALAGSVNHPVTDITVKNATISGADYIGGLVGKTYSSVTRCKVIDSSVVATGKEAGGLIGYAETNSKGSTITNNVVNNVSVYANNRAAGLVAQPNVNIKVYNNTVDTVNVGVADATQYQPGAIASNALAPENVYDNTVKNANVSTNAAAATDNATLGTAIKGGAETVFLGSGEYTLPSLKDYEGVTLIGAEGAVIGGESASTGFGSNFGKDTTIKNITFSGSSNGVRWSYANGGTSTFENCTFAGDSVYGFHIDSSNGATFIFNNCTFVGFNAFAGDFEKVVFNNCTFLSNGNYGHTNIWSVAEFNNCTWGDKTSVGQGKNSGAKLYFDGVEESYHHEFIGSAESLFAFATSVNEGNDPWKGQKVVLVADIDLENKVWTPIGQTGATEFKGIFDGQGHTIKNLNIDSSAQAGEHYSSGLFGWIESHGQDITIKNVNVDGATVIGHHNVAVIAGFMEGDSVVENCNVSNADLNNTHANDDACGDKTGVIAGYVASEVTVKSCTASDCTVTGGRDAGQLIGASYVVPVDCSATNVTVSATGDCTSANVASDLVGRKLGTAWN